ncbi:MAG: hypothetical protein U5K32_08295 [Bacteroidales bacterium]|nr:hypothetical protein [Bacteroidales bacterium]
MKTFNQEQFESFSEFLLSDEEMINVRGGDDGGKGEEVPPVTEPEI